MKEINVHTLKILFNYVLIKVDLDHETYHSTETGNDTGINIAPWGINQASHLSLTGTVVALPQHLVFNGEELTELKREKDRSEATQKRIAALRNQSMAYEVPMELAVGMRVYFEYTTRLNAFKEGRAIENEEGKFIFIPYDLLVLAFRPDTDFNDVKITDVYPLNGFVLIKPLEYATERSAQGIVGTKTESDIFVPVNPDAKFVHRDNLWYGTVLMSGCPVKSYADFPARGGEIMNDGIGMPGQKICYDGRQQKRLEVEHHRVIFKRNVLYRIHRKDIHGIFTNGKIQ